MRGPAVERRRITSSSCAICSRWSRWVRPRQSHNCSGRSSRSKSCSAYICPARRTPSALPCPGPTFRGSKSTRSLQKHGKSDGVRVWGVDGNLWPRDEVQQYRTRIRVPGPRSELSPPEALGQTNPSTAAFFGFKEQSKWFNSSGKNRSGETLVDTGNRAGFHVLRRTHTIEWALVGRGKSDTVLSSSVRLEGKDFTTRHGDRWTNNRSKAPDSRRRTTLNEGE